MNATLQMEQIVIPDLYCPFPSQINLYVEAIHAHSLRWVKRFHLVQQEVAFQRFAASRFAWLTARVHPLAGIDELALICDWHVWLFMFDDQFDDGEIGKQPERMQPVLEHLLAVVNDSCTTPRGPIAESLADFWQRAARYTTPAWQRRFVCDLAGYFDAYRWEAQNRVQGCTPDVNTYIENRRRAGSMPLVCDLIDISQRVELPPDVYDCQELQILRRTTSNVVCWVNDLYSLRRDLTRGDMHNMVVVVQQARHCSLQEAINHVCTMVETDTRLFVETEQLLPSFSPRIDQEVRKYLIDLRGWMRGNLDFSRETPRYSQGVSTLSVSSLEDILPS
jgi:hypothetical protein